MAEDLENCTTYENCLDVTTQEIIIQKDNMTILAVGCWGVYCQDGEYTKEKKGKKETVNRGQESVSKALATYKRKHPDVDDMFLVGDNIYEDKKGQYDINRQLNEGFEKCFLKSGISRFFLALGNHDIKTCDILSRQKNYKKWNFPSLYYNVVYRLNDFTINIIVLDTNMFEEEPLRCDKILFTERQIDDQSKWAKSVSKMGHWNILMGHIPYLANGHKEKKHPVKRPSLERLVKEIDPDLYVCADEHNQQFIDTKPPIAVVGSGGTALDNFFGNLIEGTTYNKSIFGFLSLDINEQALEISFINTENKLEYKNSIKKK